MPKKPFADSKLARFVDQRILELRPKKSQAEIAEIAGFTNANFLSMVKSGVSKLAIDRVPALAKALECDPAYLLRLALEQAEGNTAAVAIFEILGDPISENERGWIAEIRDASGDTDPRLTQRSRIALRTIFLK
ncbi:XRE family transcriptional regulator [Rhodobacteraceae bacterium CYK-10]|uniref:XRE family transcriptional regulator n=2 Tax=Stagnihabitans tardus TaxID=2699202 RepID=A0AAE4YCS1_9RHOB|nr:XRE family transcriptional regulator [Stagnihabitans tardus]